MASPPIPILIDINIWERLVSKDGDSPDLSRLFYLVQRGYVVLLYPQALLDEWPSNREKTRERHFKEISLAQREVNKLRTINDPSATWNEERLQTFKNAYNRQLNTIDMLFATGKAIPRTEHQGRMIGQLKAEQKAPFHPKKEKNKKKDKAKGDTNDAELIYYSLDFLEQHSYDQLYFVSDNTLEFAVKVNGMVSLHPDIAIYKKAITIHYFTDIRHTFQTFDQLGLPGLPREESLEFKRVRNTILVDRQAPLVDQILEYLEKRLKDTPFLPKELFAEHYPFISEDFFDNYPRPFTLNVDNKAVYELLAPDTKDANKTAELFLPDDETACKKLRMIRQHLFDQNIYYISYKLKDEVCLEFDSEGVRANTHFQKYYIHDFFGILQDITSEGASDLTGDIKEDLRKAFMFYKIAHYRGAATLLHKIRDAYKGQRSIHYFICCFNINRIAQLVRHSYWRSHEALELAKKSLGPDLNKEKAAVSAPEQQEILDYIHRTKFFSENSFELQTTLNSIRNYQFRQNTGFNKDGEKLLEKYFSIENFLHENSIVFDRYSEFHSLTLQYIEGILASYSCDESLGGKITIFGDDQLIPIILYGKPDEIDNHLDLYKITSLTYKPDAGGSKVYTLVCNILDQYLDIKHTFSHFIKNGITEFYDHYVRRLSNALVVLSVLNMEHALLDKVAIKLLSFQIFQTDVARGFFSKWVRLFLLRSETKLSPLVLQAYFSGVLKNKSLHEGPNISLVAHIFERRKLSLQIPAEEFDEVIYDFVERCRLCDEVHTWHDLSDIYRSLQDQAQRARISELAMAAFSEDLDPERFCLAVVCNIVQPEKELMQKCVDTIVTLIESQCKPRLANRECYYTNGKLDQFINMYWKLGLDIPASIKGMLPQLGIYYTWLSDLEQFDYSYFRPEWITHSFTRYYRLKFKNSDALKNHLKKGILNDRFDEYSKLFVKIYDIDS